MPIKSPQIRLNDDIRKAVHSGSGYEDYITLVQFINGLIDELRRRIARMRVCIASYYEDGGTIEAGESGTDFRLDFDGVGMHVSYTPEGEVESYEVDGIRGKRDSLMRMQSLFFMVYMLPQYENTLAQLDRMKRDLDNDNTLRGISELRDIIRGDKYLSVSAVSGVGVQTEGDADPFDIFSGGGQ